MLGQGIRKLMFLLCSVVFAGLLMTGGHRLIDVPEGAKSDPPVVRVVTAYLCCAPSDSVPVGARESVSQAHSAERDYAALRSAQIVQPSRRRTHADANGNVLRSVSYMRSVYQSFDLGDGFV